MDDRKKIIDAFQRYNSFLIATHINPEGDAIGSELGLWHLLRALGKNAVIRNNDAVPANLAFLPGAEKIACGVNDLSNIEVAVSVDCAGLSRLGKIAEPFQLAPLTVNIDHHMSNERFGNLNLIDAKASAAAEVVFSLFDSFGGALSEKAAICLYTAIVVDSGSFRYSCTSAHTHKIASILLSKGVKLDEITKNLYDTATFDEKKLLGLAMENLRLSPDGKIAWFWLKKKMFEAIGASEPETGEFINHISNIRGVEVSLLFRELTDTKVKVSLRSKGSVSVNEIAAKFGGGGHYRASGCVIEDSDCSKAEEMVLGEVSRAISSSAIS